jgi:hypothetical protein
MGKGHGIPKCQVDPISTTKELFIMQGAPYQLFKRSCYKLPHSGELSIKSFRKCQNGLV